MEEKFMKPIKLDADLVRKGVTKPEPAYKEVVAGLQKHIMEIYKDPLKITVSCCIEGCCVSWCCVQLS